MTDNVIQIGEMIVRRREEKKAWNKKDERCHHRKTTLDDNGSIVTCDDCSMQLSPYWVLHQLIHYYDQEMKKVEARAKAVAEDKAHNLHLLAAKKVEAVWRSRKMAPCCPHCGHGILPEDGLGGSQMGREFELRRRQHDPKCKPGLFRG